MTIADARALLPPDREPIIREHSQRRDDAALDKLARWAIRFTPLAAADPPDGLFLDVSRSLRLFGGVDRIMRRLVRGVNKKGFTCRAVAAPTFGAAWAMARYMPSRCKTSSLDSPACKGSDGGPDLFAAGVQARLEILNPCAAVLRAERESDTASVLAPLPVAALRLDGETISALEEVGVLTIGHTLNLPRRALPSRFGPTLTMRLQQALGYMGERIEPARIVEPVQAEQIFNGPTTDTASIEACVQALLRDCAAQLHHRGLGVRRLELVLERSDLDPVVVEITLSRPSASPGHLWALLRPRVEKSNLGFGVQGIKLRMPRHSKLVDAQAPLPSLDRLSSAARPDTGPALRAAAELIDSLAARFSSGKVCRMDAAQSHLPERIFGFRAAIEVDEGLILRAITAEGANGLVTHSPRPTRLVHPPRPLRVMALSPDGPVVRMHIGGEDLVVRTSIGPERIGEEWWRGTGSPDEAFRARDYFRVQDEGGRWLWIFRDATTARWWLHGIWD